MEFERAVVVGVGEVGRKLAAALHASKTEVVEVTRTDNWDIARSAPAGVPRLLCVREDDLEPVLRELDAVAPESLVAVQNGWIKPLLDSRPGATRGLIWFTAKGDFFRPLRPSPFCGPLAAALTERLSAGGLPTEVTAQRTFAELDADKMGFNCVVGLPLAVHGLTLGEYLQQHATEAEAVFSEAATVCAAAAGVSSDAAWWPAFVETVEPLHWVATSSAKALDFRNGAVVRLARDLGMEAPANRRLLDRVGWQG